MTELCGPQEIARVTADSPMALLLGNLHAFTGSFVCADMSLLCLPYYVSALPLIPRLNLSLRYLR